MPTAFQLAFTAGPRQGESVPLADDEVTLGRSKANHIVVADPAVSRRHLTFRVTDKRVVLSAGESIGGTNLNSQPFTGDRELKHGDLIGLGDSCFQFLIFSKTDAFGKADEIFSDPDEVARKFGRPKGLADTQRMDNLVPMGGTTVSGTPPGAPQVAAPNVARDWGNLTWLWIVLAALIGGGIVYLFFGG